MRTALQDLQPKEIWKHFDAIANIPRDSKKENAAREYVLSIAKRLGLESERDDFGNTVVRKPARPGREKAPVSLLQGHLDMVCEKNEGTRHDFDKDPIEILRDGDWLKAKGTTLGSDNGIGLSAALAVMESNDIAHGPLEFVFTVQEEIGLVGASHFPGGLLKSRFFLNLDNEEIGTLCIGCSGGVNTTARRKLAFHPGPGGPAWRVKVSGLKGGHSGVDIHQGRGNALRILARVLQAAMDKASIALADIRGGSARNAIPREAAAVVTGGKQEELQRLAAEYQADIQAELGSFDAGLQISVEKAEPPQRVLEAGDARRIVDLLASLPHGVLAMSPDIAGLVQTSTNVATVAIEGDQVEVGTSQRSAIESSKQATARMIANLCRFAGFETEHGAAYPGWKPDPNSDIVRKLQEAHQELFQHPARLIAMHAGLECGVIGEKYPGMQMVSFGPQIENPHSPNERVQISTVESFWRFLRKVLEKL